MISNEVSKAVENINTHVPDARKGLPQDVFFLVSRLTPLIATDLLIKNEKGQCLLVFREDQFYKGWHIAGGIIRFKERIAERIAAVAQHDFGATVEFDPNPIYFCEKFAPDRDIRGHFISLLFNCRITSPTMNFDLECKDPNSPKAGQWMWHDRCPTNLIHQHEMYRKYIDP